MRWGGKVWENIWYVIISNAIERKQELGIRNWEAVSVQFVAQDDQKASLRGTF